MTIPDLLQPVEAEEAVKPEVEYKYSDCAEAFMDKEVGGLAISLPHGSVVFECARHELHATTALNEPNRVNPTRIGNNIKPIESLSLLPVLIKSPFGQKCSQL